jgi:hypothetical protein
VRQKKGGGGVEGRKETFASTNPPSIHDDLTQQPHPLYAYWLKPATTTTPFMLTEPSNHAHSIHVGLIQKPHPLHSCWLNPETTPTPLMLTEPSNHTHAIHVDCTDPLCDTGHHSVDCTDPIHVEAPTRSCAAGPMPTHSQSTSSGSGSGGDDVGGGSPSPSSPFPSSGSVPVGGVPVGGCCCSLAREHKRHCGRGGVEGGFCCPCCCSFC